MALKINKGKIKLLDKNAIASVKLDFNMKEGTYNFNIFTIDDLMVKDIIKVLIKHEKRNRKNVKSKDKVR